VRIRPLLLLATLLAAACTPTEMPVLPADDVPAEWQGPAPASAPVWPEEEWWRQFGGEELTGLIAGVEAANLDLANAERALAAAQIALEQAGFDLYPTPVVSVGGRGTYSGFAPDGGSYSDRGSDSYSFDISLTYADILSKPSRYEAAEARYDAAEARFAGTRLNLLGTAASTYFQVLLLRDRIATAEQSLADATEIARIADARVRAGTATPVDALQQRIAVERQRNQVRNFRQAELEARSALALLVARNVNAVEVGEKTLAVLDVPEIKPGIPSELLVRRPDLVEAEASLRASRANVDLVRTAYLPDISLTASGSLASDSLKGLIDSPDLAVTGTASLVQVLLDNGTRRRNVELARLELESALANYRRAAISAFNDIEVALSNIALLLEQERVALDDRARAEEAFRISELRYKEGVSDYQSLLTSQGALYSARLAVLDNRLARLNAVVALYQALGGGWQAAP
jgi:NodT family efflux transporter outer membrane factor (OMF) lipoprotein